jgi:hypothetical protein
VREATSQLPLGKVSILPLVLLDKHYFIIDLLN